jgi:hypothetical protein
VILIPYAYFQANYWHLEYKFWYIYLILALIPWIDYIFTNRDDLRLSTKNLITKLSENAGNLFDRIFNNTKKASIIGATWGLISPFLMRLTLIDDVGTLSLIPKTVGLPFYIAMKFVDSSGCMDMGCVLLFFIWSPLAILIGALIGYTISKIYLKVRK